MLLLITQMVFFEVMHVFLQFSWIAIFAGNRHCWHLENYDLKEVIQTLTQFSPTNNWLDVAHSKRKFSLERYMCFFNWAEKTYLEQAGTIGTWKTLTCREYSFQTLCKFSEANNVLDVATSNIDGFPWRDTCVSSTQLNRTYRSKQRLSSPWKVWFAGSIPFKN
jgi:hypothetical protein